MLVAFPLVGGLTRSWWSLALPPVGWPLLYLGLGQGWWGDGLGDAWQYPASALWLIGLVSTAAAVAGARRFPRDADHDRALAR